MIKLIVADMDGTLLNDDKKMPDDMISVIQKLHNKGIRFAVASGRQYQSLKENFPGLEHDMVFIAENGMLVIENDKELLSHTLPLSSVQQFIQTARSIPFTNVVRSGKQTAYIENSDPQYVEAVRKYYADVTIVDTLDHIQDACIKIAIHNDYGTQEQVYPHFQKYETDFMVSVSAREWMDIMCKNIHKGKAVREIRDLYHIAYEETMIFGDFMNDYEMMKEGYFSYAMKNAIPEVKEAANFITEYTNNEEGVLREIKKQFLDL